MEFVLYVNERQRHILKEELEKRLARGLELQVKTEDERLRQLMQIQIHETRELWELIANAEPE